MNSFVAGCWYLTPSVPGSAKFLQGSLIEPIFSQFELLFYFGKEYLILFSSTHEFKNVCSGVKLFHDKMTRTESSESNYFKA